VTLFQNGGEKSFPTRGSGRPRPEGRYFPVDRVDTEKAVDELNGIKDYMTQELKGEKILIKGSEIKATI
jgi:hypothetical protein